MSDVTLGARGAIASGAEQRFRWHRRLIDRSTRGTTGLARRSAGFAARIGRPLSAHAVFGEFSVVQPYGVSYATVRPRGNPFIAMWRRGAAATAPEGTSLPRAGVLPRVTKGVQAGFAPGSGLARLQRDVLAVRLLPEVSAIGPVLTARERRYTGGAARRKADQETQPLRFHPAPIAPLGVRAEGREGSGGGRGEERVASASETRSIPGASHGHESLQEESSRAHDSPSGGGGQPAADDALSFAHEELRAHSLRSPSPLPRSYGGDAHGSGDRPVGHGGFDVGAQLERRPMPAHDVGRTTTTQGGVPAVDPSLLAISMLLLGRLGDQFLQVRAAREGVDHITEAGPFWQYSRRFPHTDFRGGSASTQRVGVRLRDPRWRSGGVSPRDPSQGAPIRQGHSWAEGFERLGGVSRDSGEAGRPHQVVGPRSGPLAFRVTKQTSAAGIGRLWGRQLTGDRGSSPGLSSGVMDDPDVRTHGVRGDWFLPSSLPRFGRGAYGRLEPLLAFALALPRSESVGPSLGQFGLPIPWSVPRRGESYQRFLIPLARSGTTPASFVARKVTPQERTDSDATTIPRRRGPLRVDQDGASRGRHERGVIGLQEDASSLGESHETFPDTDMVAERSRSLPAALLPLAMALGVGESVRVRTGPATSRALRRVGKKAATAHGIIHLEREYDASPHALGVLAHELVHVQHQARRSNAGPRFYHDQRLDQEEIRARRVGNLVASLVGEATGGGGLMQASTSNGVSPVDSLAVIAPGIMASGSRGRFETPEEPRRWAPTAPVQHSDGAAETLAALYERFRTTESGSLGSAALSPTALSGRNAGGEEGPSSTTSVSPVGTRVPWGALQGRDVLARGPRLAPIQMRGGNAVTDDGEVVSSSSAPKAEEFLDWLVEQVERRMLREMESQGRRHMPDVL